MRVKREIEKGMMGGRGREREKMREKGGLKESMREKECENKR